MYVLYVFFFRNRHILTTHTGYIRKNVNNAERRSSLPPLTRTQNYNSQEKFERDLGGETSGYGSDNANHTPEHSRQMRWSQGGYESSSSCREERMKWGDRGVGVGKFWEAREINDNDKTINNDTPNWVKRGLQRDEELIVANSSPSESPEQDYGEHDRPCTGSSNSLPNRYINTARFNVDTRNFISDLIFGAKMYIWSQQNWQKEKEKDK